MRVVAWGDFRGGRGRSRPPGGGRRLERALAAFVAPVVVALLAPGPLGPSATRSTSGPGLRPAGLAAAPAPEPGGVVRAAAGSALPAMVAAAPVPDPAPAEPEPPPADAAVAVAQAEPAPAPPPPAPPQLAAALAARLADRRLAGTMVGLSIWIDGLGEVAASDADALLVPASTQKLAVAAAVLATMGPETTLVTEVRTAGVIDGGTLLGDLVLVGGGDPLLRSRGPHSLDHLAAAVRGLGVVRVTGSLVGDETRYDAVREASGWQPGDLPNFVGPLSALVVDGNDHRHDPPFVTDPVPGNVALFRAALQRHGVVVVGGDQAGVTPAGSRVVAALASPPIDVLVGRMLAHSDNLVAELLLKEVGLRRRGVGSTTEGAAAADAVLAELGAGGHTVDGSGLSRDNRRSARDWRLVLQAARTRPWGPRLVAALAVGGHSGTLTHRFAATAAEGNVRAKTGAIRGVRAISGYVTTAAGRPVVFSAVVNAPWLGPPVRRALDDLVVTLAADSS